MKKLAPIFVLSIFLLSFSMLKSLHISSEGIIKDGENLTYVASYKMGFMTDIAQINMATSKVATKTNEFYRFKCTASTFSRWDSWFKIRDLYESYVSTKTLKPVLYNRDINEGGYIKKVKYKFKRSKGIAQTTITKRRGDGTDWIRNFNAKIGYHTHDMVSAIYNTRTLNFDTFNTGKVIPMDVLIDGEVMKAYVTYQGKETIQVNNLGNKECYKLSLDFKKGTFDKAEGSKNMWITADDTRMIALIKAKLPFGSVQIRLKDID